MAEFWLMLLIHRLRHYIRCFIISIVRIYTFFVCNWCEGENMPFWKEYLVPALCTNLQERDFRRQSFVLYNFSLTGQVTILFSIQVTKRKSWWRNKSLGQLEKKVKAWANLFCISCSFVLTRFSGLWNPPGFRNISQYQHCPVNQKLLFWNIPLFKSAASCIVRVAACCCTRALCYCAIWWLGSYTENSVFANYNVSRLKSREWELLLILVPYFCFTDFTRSVSKPRTWHAGNKVFGMAVGESAVLRALSCGESCRSLEHLWLLELGDLLHWGLFLISTAL